MPDGIHAGFQFGFRVERERHAAGGKGFFQRFLHADLGQAGVGHDERAGSAESFDFIGGMPDGVGAVYDSADGIVDVKHAAILAGVVDD